MNQLCPQCGVDITGSSGVVCPECGLVLRPGEDSTPLLRQRRKPRSAKGTLLSFLIPGGAIVVWMLLSGAPALAALVSGTVGGALFFLSWIGSGRVSDNLGGQIVVGILFFFGGILILAAVFFTGCFFLFRG